MKKNLFLTCIMCALFTIGKAQDIPASFSLEEAVEWGVEYNRTLKRASLEYQKAHKEKWKTISIGFPQINANLNYQNNIEQPVSLIPAQFFWWKSRRVCRSRFWNKTNRHGNGRVDATPF
ncbi:MAG: hypothetical protein ABF261_01660 [Candidatus Arcticimaribacter sp.]